MVNRIKKYLMIAAFGVALVAPLSAHAPVGAQASAMQDRLCSGANLGSSSTGDCAGSTSSSDLGVQNAAKNIVNLLSWVVGVVSVIMIIVAGFRYITSAGASDKVTGAKNTLIYAVIGLIIVALAQFIVNFVLKEALGAANP